jgi:two-component system sensor histidine kinase RegB
MVSERSEVRHVVAWLPAVRWTTCAALWTAVGAVWMFPHLDLPLRAVAPVGLTAAICRTSLEITRHLRGAAPRWLLGISLGAEAALLTGLLDITGGPFNPFILMYPIYVWLTATAASPRWAVLVSGVSLAGFGWLLFDHLQAEIAEHHRLNDFPTHLFTMWICSTAVLELVIYHVLRADAALAQRQQLLEQARARAARSEHHAALMTLAAGAAHELSTPLATIAVTARELERTTAQLTDGSSTVREIRDDARLIRAEVDRCQGVLDGMSGRATSGVAAGSEPLLPEAIARLARERLTPAQQQRLTIEIETPRPLGIEAGPDAVQAVSALLKNAFDASGPGRDVRLRVVQRASMVRIEVHDGGEGMSDEVRQRAGEPFFTTKAPGRGMGLGVFLARAFAERSGGTLEFEIEHGTTAVMEIPIDARQVTQA